jgi:hypothetical protein
MRYPPRRPRTLFHIKEKQIGRPLSKKYFGELNVDNIGGEGISSVTLGGTNNSSGYTTGDALTISAPQIAGGTQAVGTVNAFANGAIGNVSISTVGSGYTSATISAATGTQGTLTLTAVLTSADTSTARRNAIIPQVRISGTNRTSGNDILKQVGSKRFSVKSQDGTGVCKLVAATPSAAGEMAIAATDSQNSTYWVRKITKNKVELVQNTDGGTGFDFADGASAKWTITGSAAAPTAGGRTGATDGPTVADLVTVVLTNA